MNPFRSLRFRFAAAAAAPALAALAGMAFYADSLSRRALENELGARIAAVAQAAAADLPAERVLLLQPGDEGTRTYANVQARLSALAKATGVRRLFIARPDRSALADSDGLLRVGEPMPELERDRVELGEVLAGRAQASRVLFRGSDGRDYKAGYAPLVHPATGAVLAIVGADGSAAQLAGLRAFRRLLAALAFLGALLAAAAAVAASLSVTRPVARLASAARRIARGDLETPMVASGQDEVGLLGSTLEEMRQALAARDRDRALMVAGIAHEVRNPLGGIDLFSGLLAEQVKGSPELASHAERIRKELGYLRRIVDEFLDFAGEKALSPELIEPAAFAAEVCALVVPTAEPKRVRVIAQPSGGAFKADRLALRRAALNLLRNAVEASPEGAEVRLTVITGPGGMSLSVEDKGPGVPEDKLKEIFKPFFTTKEKGTGLGLALVKKIAEAHGGSVRLENRPGGCAAILELPPLP